MEKKKKHVTMEIQVMQNDIASLSPAKKLALNAHTLAEIFKEQYKYQIITERAGDKIINKLFAMAPKLAEAMTSNLLETGQMPTPQQLAETTGQPEHYCCLMILNSSNQIASRVAKARKGLSVEEILYDFTSREVEVSEWVDVSPGKGENYIWDEEWQQGGHYIYKTKTVVEKKFLIDVETHVLEDIFNKLVLNTSHTGSYICGCYTRILSKEEIDEYIEKEYPL